MTRLYNDDCLNIIKEIPDESIDLVVTDCPYHIVSGGCSNEAVKIGFNAGGIVADSHGNRYYTDSKHVSLTGMFNDANPICYMKNGALFKYNEIKFSDWLPEIYRVLKQGTHCYVMINARNLKDLQQAAEDAGFKFQQLLVWDKGNSTPNKYYLNSFELILMLRKGRAKNINNLGTKNILRIPNIMRGRNHPTEKPPELMRILIENSSNIGDTVLDPFMGVGGAGIASIESKREFIGIEIDEKYYSIAKQRIDDIEHPKQLTIFDFIKENV